MADAPAAAWSAFLEDVAASRAKLLGELADLHRNVRDITAELGKRRAVAELDWPRGQTATLRTIFETNATALLLDPLERHTQSRIHDRLPGSFEDFRSELAEATRKLPGRTELAPVSLIETLPANAKLPFLARWAGRRKRVRTVEVRRSVRGGLHLLAFRTGPLEGRIYLAFAQATLALLDPWQALRDAALLRLQGDDAATDPRGGHAAWKQQAEAREAGLQRALASLDAVLSGIEVRLLGAVLGPERYRRLGGKRARRHAAWEDYWERQQRSVRALVETEHSLVRLGKRTIVAVERSARALGEERGAVVAELGAGLEALERWQPGRENPLPPGSAQLTPASQHLRQWKRLLGGHARTLLPAEIEAVDPRRALPGWRVPWRTVRPAQTFLAALDLAAKPVAAVLDDVGGDHKAVLRDIERAREVVTFGIRTAAGRASREVMVRESVGNAALLLGRTQRTLPERGGVVEAAYVEATAACFHRYHVGVEQGRLTLLTYLAREGIARAARRASRLAVEQGRRIGSATRVASARFYHAALIKIGLEAPPETVESPVVRWRAFPDAADVDVEARRLPLIYHRLFRSEPVEDLRFLVGREAEMAALADARALWDAGRSTAVVIYGQRGSGKTSLINCAVARSFTGLDVVRGSFRDRVLTRQAVRSFLAELLGTGSGDLDGLVADLSSRRRVIVIEELERTFLRAVGGLEALKELLRIMTRSVPSTVWIVSLASEAFHFLDAAVDLGQHFSHRINASAVPPADLREAILQRHHLSGLRLKFEGHPAGQRFGARFHAWAGAGDDESEAAFFAALYRQSGGIFRSAFGLWRHNIDRAAGGVLYMRFPDVVDHAEITGEFSRDELFTLHLLQQHGSLTLDEHAEIFGWRREVSRAVVERLLGRHMIEADPGAPGVRIHAPAAMLARAALSARNLV